MQNALDDICVAEGRGLAQDGAQDDPSDDE